MWNSLLKGQRLPNVSRHITRPNGFINKSLTHKQAATRTSNRLGKKKSNPKPFPWIFLSVFWLSGFQNLNVTDVFLNLLSLTTCSTQKPLKVAHVKRISHISTPSKSTRLFICAHNRLIPHQQAFPGGADTRNAGEKLEVYQEQGTNQQNNHKSVKLFSNSKASYFSG